MAGCCGGKNGGKPISRGRYLAGLAFFTSYHGAVQAALVGAALVNRRLKPVQTFHRQYFGHLLREALVRDGITIGEPADGCAVE